jgi:hypothetical protein
LWSKPLSSGKRWEPFPDAGAVEQTDCPVLDQAGADAAQHIFAAALLEYDVCNPVDLQQLPEIRPARRR